MNKNLGVLFLIAFGGLAVPVAIASGPNFNDTSYKPLTASVGGNFGIGTTGPRTLLEVDGIIYGTNIGVNTTAPQARLDVEGDVYFANGTVTINLQ